MKNFGVIFAVLVVATLVSGVAFGLLPKGGGPSWTSTGGILQDSDSSGIVPDFSPEFASRLTRMEAMPAGTISAAQAIEAAAASQWQPGEIAAERAKYPVKTMAAIYNTEATSGTPAVMGRPVWVVTFEGLRAALAQSDPECFAFQTGMIVDGVTAECLASWNAGYPTHAAGCQ